MRELVMNHKKVFIILMMYILVTIMLTITNGFKKPTVEEGYKLSAGVESVLDCSSDY